ncbi:MAG TPA: hypothetical protein VD995_16120 [Azospirillum sp.]|nr:hypothetical protein [Azospirillum sp.]
MDLTTLTGALVVAFGLLSTNAILNSGTIMVDMSVPGSIASDGIEAPVAEMIFERELQNAVSVPSVVPPPDIRGSREKTLAAALADALKVEDLTFALQMAVGFQPARLQGSVIIEDKSTVLLIDGFSGPTGSFTLRVPQNEGETVAALLQRGAVEALWKMQPYLAALHTFDRELKAGRVDAHQARVEETIAAIPDTPVSRERALLLNLLGVSALFENDIESAGRHFKAAAQSDPANIVPILNDAFIDLYYDRYAEAEAKMKQALVPKAMSENPVLVSTAYSTWAVARFGLRDLAGAEKLLKHAVTANPQTSTAYQLWADIREDMGDMASAAKLNERARINSAHFENYAELAILYFEPSWQDGQTLKPNTFGRPARTAVSVSLKD